MNPVFRRWKLLAVLFHVVWLMQSFAALAQTSYPPGACKPIPGSQSCSDATPCKTSSTGQQICLSTAIPPAGALQVPYSCWQYTYHYACAGGTTDTCAQYRNDPACGVVKSVCMDTTPETGQCNEWQYTYKCLTQAQQTSQQTTCTSGLFDNGQFPTPAPGKGSFANGAIGLEILGEAARYRDGNGIFSGVAESCRKGYGGVQNCCKSMPGAQSNSQVMTTVLGAAASTVKYAGEKLVDMASPYVFDAMYTNGIFSEALASNFSLADGSLGTALSAGGMSVGAYGFTVGSGTMSAGLLGGNMQLASFGSNGYLAFNPYVFAIMVAIQVYQALSKCSEAEQLLAMHRGANLSVFIQETCSKKSFGSCVQYVDEYCSFNSVLAKIVNIQGKTQLGLPLAGCAGLTPDQISAIDFTKVDFSEFTDLMMNQATSHLPSNINGNYQPIEQGSHSGTAQSNANPALPSY